MALLAEGLSSQHLPSPCSGPRGGPLGLEEGQAAPEALLQELQVRGRGRVFKGGREAEGAVLHVLGPHGGEVQEVVGVDVVDLGERLGEVRGPPGSGPPAPSARPLVGEVATLRPHLPSLRRTAARTLSEPTPGPAASLSCLCSHRAL